MEVKVSCGAPLNVVGIASGENFPECLREEQHAELLGYKPLLLDGKPGFRDGVPECLPPSHSGEVADPH